MSYIRSGLRPGFPERGTEADYLSEISRRLSALERGNSIAAHVDQQFESNDAPIPDTIGTLVTATVDVPEWVEVLTVHAYAIAHIVDTSATTFVRSGTLGITIDGIASPGQSFRLGSFDAGGFDELNQPIPMVFSRTVTMPPASVTVEFRGQSTVATDSSTHFLSVAAVGL